MCIPYYILYICRLFPPAWVTEISKPSTIPAARSVSVAVGVNTNEEGWPETDNSSPFWGNADTLFYNEEFDPGSGWTLATGLTHASRGVTGISACTVVLTTGARVSNAYPTFPWVVHSPAKVGLIHYMWHFGIFMSRKIHRSWMGMRLIRQSAG